MAVKTRISLGLIAGMVWLLWDAAGVAQAVPRFRMVVVDDAVKIGYGLALEDVDGDGKRDIVLADKDVFAWYQNPDWTKHVIAQQITERDHVCLAARDLDGDGRVEIAVGAGWNPGNTIDSGAVGYLIPPDDRTKPWELVRLPYEPTTHRMRWVRNADNAYDLIVVPLHGRGNQGAQGDGVRTLAYHRPADPKKPWLTSLVSDSLHISHNLEPVQWDADAAEEILIAGREGVRLCDWRDGRWHESTVVGPEVGHEDFIGAGEVRMGSLGDRLPVIATIEPLHGNQVVVYTNPHPHRDGSAWSRRVLDDSLRQGHALAFGDLLGLGHDQLVAGWRQADESGKVGIKLFVPSDGQGSSWKTYWVDANTMACEDLRLADMNGDGKLDIVAAGRATNNLVIYYNAN